MPEARKTTTNRQKTAYVNKEHPDMAWTERNNQTNTLPTKTNQAGLTLKAACTYRQGRGAHARHIRHKEIWGEY